MPLRASSARITDGYRRRRVALRDRAGREAAAAWAQVRTEDIGGSFPAGQLALRVSVLQREAARLAGGYVQAFVESETGEPAPHPTVDARQVGSGYGGADLRASVQSSVAAAKRRIGGGEDPAAAVALERARLVRAMGLAVDEAARSALAEAIRAEPRISGWQRAVRGTCGACLAAADWARTDEAPFEVHPGCECVAEPIVRPRYGDPERLPAFSPGDSPGVDAYVFGERATNGEPWFQEINAALRDTRFSRDLELSENISAIERTFSYLPKTDEPLQLLRGIDTPLEELFPQLAGKDLVGKVIADSAYVSTTTKENIARMFAGSDGGDLWILSTKAGNKALRVTGGLNEGEVLLDHGQRFLITAVDAPAGPHQPRVIHAEVLYGKAKPPPEGL